MASPHTTPPLDQRGAAFVLAVLKAMTEKASADLTAGKDRAAGDYFRPGDRYVVPHPDDGEQVGLVWMTKPKPVAEVANRAAFLAWAQEERPDDVEQVVSVVRGRDSEVVEALAKHAPHLLQAPRERVTEQGEAAVLRDAVKKNAAPVPGVEVRTPRGNVTVKLDDEAAVSRLCELVTSGRVPLRELPEAAPKDGAL